MKKLFFSAFLLLGFVAAFSQRAKIYTSVQTTNNNLVQYGNGIPTHNPGAFVFDTLAQNYLDTTNNIEFVWGTNLWLCIGIVRQNDPPLPVNTTANPDVSYKDAIWIDANDSNNEYYFDEVAVAWVPLGNYHGTSAPTDIAATGSTGAVTYTRGFWYDTANSKTKFYTGSTWAEFSTSTGGYNTGFSLVGTTLTITDGGGALNVTFTGWDTDASNDFPLTLTGTTNLTGGNNVLNFNGLNRFGIESTNGIVGLPYGTSTGNTTALLSRELAAGGTNATGFRAPDALGSDIIYVLPSSAGSAGQFLTWNASNVLSWTTASGVTGGAVGSGGVQRVTFWKTATLLDDNSLFVLDTVNLRLGLGTAAPGYKLHLEVVTTAGMPNDGFRIVNNTDGANYQIQNQLINNVGSYAFFGLAASSYTGFAPLNSGKAFVGSNGTDFSIFTQSANDIAFFPNATQAMVIKSGGNVGIGASPSARLHVVGSGSTSSTWGLQVHNSSGTSNSLMVRDDGQVAIGTASPILGFKLHVFGSSLFGTTTNGFSISPGYAGNNELPSGALIGSYDDDLMFFPSTWGVTVGAKVVMGYWNGTGRSAVEVANVSSGNGTLLLMKSGGNVGIGTDTPDKLLGLSDGTDEFSISILSDKFTFWNDNATPAALATIDSIGTWDFNQGNLTDINRVTTDTTNSTWIQASDIKDKSGTGDLAINVGDDLPIIVGDDFTLNVSGDFTLINVPADTMGISFVSKEAGSDILGVQLYAQNLKVSGATTVLTLPAWVTTLLGDLAAASYQTTLPAPSATYVGKTVRLIRVNGGGNTWTIDTAAAGSEFYNNGSATASITLANGEEKTLVCIDNASNYFWGVID